MALPEVRCPNDAVIGSHYCDQHRCPQEPFCCVGYAGGCSCQPGHSLHKAEKKPGLFAQIVQRFRRRKALRVLGHAKFYLFATTSAYGPARGGRQRDNEAITLLTTKLWEVYNGR